MRIHNDYWIREIPVISEEEENQPVYIFKLEKIDSDTPHSKWKCTNINRAITIPLLAKAICLFFKKLDKLDELTIFYNESEIKFDSKTKSMNIESIQEILLTHIKLDIKNKG